MKILILALLIMVSCSAPVEQEPINGQEPEMNIETMRSMKLHEVVLITPRLTGGGSMRIMRVPNGWIYYGSDRAVFVPLL